jgi:RNA polymerase sigma-70 factor (ECF subfamily)
MPARDIESIYADYAKLVYWAAYGACKNPADAADATQATFLRVMKHLPKLAAMDDAQIKGWLYRVAVNLCTDSFRKKKREVLVEQDDEAQADPSAYNMPEAAAIAKEDKERVRLAIDTLPEIYREVILLHYFAGYDYKSIAASLGISENTVKSRVLRAKQKLYLVLMEGGERLDKR